MLAIRLMHAHWKSLLFLLGCAATLGGCKQREVPAANLTPASAPAQENSHSQIAAEPVVPPELQWFHEVTNETGIDFHHCSGTNSEKPFPAANGSGLAAFDYDLDGSCDLYFATGTPFPINPQATTPFNHCYRNMGEWRFVDVTQACGLGHAGYSAGVAIGD